MLTHKLIVMAVFLASFCGVLCLMVYHAGRRLEGMGHLPPEPVTTKRNRTFPRELIQAARRVAFDIGAGDLNPPLQVGEECQLIGYVGPIMTVVDASEEVIVAAWDGGHQEHNFDRYILVRPLEPVYPAKATA